MSGLRRAGTATLVVVMLAACPPIRLPAQETSLSIYTDGRALVRRTLPVALQRGRQSVNAELGVRAFDPTSLVALGEGVEINALNLVTATGQEGALQRAVGRELDFLVRTGDSLSFLRATLLSVDPPAVRYQGRVLYQLPGTPALPEDVVRLAHGVALDVTAAQPRPNLELSYLVEGVRWQASYAVTLPPRGTGRAAVTGTATLENPGGLGIENAQVQLVAGSIRRVSRPGVPRPMMARAAAVAGMEVAAEMPEAESVGEVRVYALPERVSFAAGVTRAVPLIARTTADVTPVYSLEQPQVVIVEGETEPQRDLRPEITYVLRRAPRTPFGDVPLPAGVARVYAPDAQGRPQLVGEAMVGHTPAGRDIRLTTGQATDITAERVQTAFVRQTRREILGSFRVSLRNAKDEGVTVEVTDRFYGQVDVLSSTVPAERVSASAVRFPVAVPAGGEAVLEYRVRVRQ